MSPHSPHVEVEDQNPMEKKKKKKPVGESLVRKDSLTHSLPRPYPVRSTLYSGFVWFIFL